VIDEEEQATGGDTAGYIEPTVLGPDDAGYQEQEQRNCEDSTGDIGNQLALRNAQQQAAAQDYQDAQDQDLQNFLNSSPGNPAPSNDGGDPEGDINGNDFGPSGPCVIDQMVDDGAPGTMKTADLIPTESRPTRSHKEMVSMVTRKCIKDDILKMYHSCLFIEALGVFRP